MNEFNSEVNSKYFAHTGQPITTHQALITEGIINTAQQEPKRPQVFKPEVQQIIGWKNQQPYQDKFDVHHTAVKTQKRCGLIQENVIFDGHTI